MKPVDKAKDGRWMAMPRTSDPSKEPPKTRNFFQINK